MRKPISDSLKRKEIHHTGLNKRKKTDLINDCRIKINALSVVKMELIKLQQQNQILDLKLKQEEHDLKISHMKETHALKMQLLKLEIAKLKGLSE